MAISDTEALTRVIEHREIFHDEMLELMRRIMGGEMSPVISGSSTRRKSCPEIVALPCQPSAAGASVPLNTTLPVPECASPSRLSARPSPCTASITS